MTLERIFLLSAAVLVVASTVRAAPPERVTLRYELIRDGSVVGDVVETLVHDGRSYSITSELKGRGLLALYGMKRTSRGRITQEGLRPDEFRDQRPFNWVATARFDWEARSVTQERKGKSQTLKMPATAQDPLTLAYTFAFSPPTAKEYDVVRADGRWLTPFRFAVVGKEKLATPAGEIPTLRIAKVRDGPEDKATDIWFAAERDFLPVRLLVVESDGTRNDQVLTRIGE